MVSFADVKNNNASLHSAGSGLTAVLVGATNGIGLGAFRSLVSSTDSPTIYLVGRSLPRLEELISEAKQKNPTAKIHPIVAKDLTLVREAQKAAREIARSVSKIDLLIMSPGYLAMDREETPEGLDAVTAVRFYSRMAFLVILAPLLNAAPSPRVVTVLAGGSEGPLWKDDMTLKTHYSLINAAGAGASLNTLFLEEFAKKPENRKISFVHLYPGLVGGTAIKFKGLSWYMMLLLDYVVAPLLLLFGYTPDEAGGRVVFAATNGRFRRLPEGIGGTGTLIEKGSDGKVGSGVYLVQGNSSVVPGNKALDKLRAEGMGEVVYQHTLQKFDELDAM